MDSAIQADMTADMLMAFRSVPCKKRPLSWYKPPTSPASPPSPSCPSSPSSPASPASPASSTASSTSSQGDDVLVASSNVVINEASSSVPTMLWPAAPGQAVAAHQSIVLQAVARSLVMTPAMTATTSLADHHHQHHHRGPTTLNAVPATPATPATPLQPPPMRRQSDFSIEHILRDTAGRRRPSPTEDRLQHLPDDEEAQPVEGHFEWLQCTRYRPPKLPRTRRRDGPAQRRLGRNPRIPFSPQQVAVLEGRFRCSHYLCSADVADLSAQLQLSETRVKIWFQNRRARERRDGEGRSAASPQRQTQSPTVKALVNAPTPTPSHLPRSPVSAFSAPKSLSMKLPPTEHGFST